MSDQSKNHFQRVRANIRQHVSCVTGQEALSRGVELATMVRVAGNLYEAIDEQSPDGIELSAARWSLLMRLFVAERHLRPPHPTPTDLSHGMNVGKNTISALLNGLEEQGLIERALDRDDRRIFRIKLTDAGRELVERSAPRRIQMLNQVISDLSEAEQEQLIMLLDKLARSLIHQGNLPVPRPVQRDAQSLES